MVAKGQCVHQVPLPTYDIDLIRTGLYTRVAADASAVLRREGAPRWQSKTLANFVAGSYRNVNSDGQWQLNTVDSTSWEIDTKQEGTGMRRLFIYETDAVELSALAALQQGDLIRVEVDAQQLGRVYRESVHNH